MLHVANQRQKRIHVYWPGNLLSGGSVTLSLLTRKYYHSNRTFNSSEFIIGEPAETHWSTVIMSTWHCDKLKGKNNNGSSGLYENRVWETKKAIHCRVHWCILFFHFKGWWKWIALSYRQAHLKLRHVHKNECWKIFFGIWRAFFLWRLYWNWSLVNLAWRMSSI